MILIIIIYLLFIINDYIEGSQCGNGTIPFSFEVLKDGQPILGCARTTCLGWLGNGSFGGSNVKFWKMDGHPDGYLRAQNFSTEDIYINQYSSNSIVKCEDDFTSKHCGKSGEWVGGIKPIPYEKLLNTTMRMKCCSYDKLLDSFDQGVGEVNPGQIIVGGEVFNNGRQVAFEYIADIHKKIDYGRILYTVTTRRFKCGRGSNEYKQHIGRRKLKKINVIMKKKVNKESIKKQINNKIKKNKNVDNLSEIAFIKLLEEIQMAQDAISRSKTIKNIKNKNYYKQNLKNDIRMAPKKNINLDIVEVNESSNDSSPRYQAYWDAQENRWKYKAFMRRKVSQKINNDMLFPSDDSIISESYIEDHSVPPIPVTVKPKLRKKKLETSVYVQIPKRTTLEPQYLKTERLTMNQNVIPTTPPIPQPQPQPQPQPERTINWFGEQLVPGKTYKVYDTLTPELSYEFTVPEILGPLATPQPPPPPPSTLLLEGSQGPLNLLHSLQHHHLHTPPASLDQTLRSILTPQRQMSLNIRRSPINHDILISTTTMKPATSNLIQKPLTNIVIEKRGDSVNTMGVENFDQIIPEDGRKILNKIASTLLGAYYNRLML
uniref:WxxW domain-containing protein n=1 Tax=Strongyloides stercoralis TaxID=6248 RepID=A0A0K0EF84_STRER